MSSDNDLIFGDLVISGFLSYPPRKHQKINLNSNRLTAIIGTNYDGGPGERNGAGKSAIIDALQYLYFGHSTRLANKGFLNVVEPGPLLVSGWAQRNGIIFQVQRGENPSVLRLWEKPTTDPRDLFDTDSGRYVFETTKSTKPETTKRITELLGFDLKLTEVLLVNNPSDKSCYFLKEASDQRDIQERIFGFTEFTEKAVRLRELKKEESRNLATKESALVATRQANDRVLAEIALLEEKAQKWAADRDHQGKYLTHQIRTFTGVDFDAEKTLLTTIGEIDNEISRLNHETGLAQITVSDVKRRHDQWQQKHQEEVTGLEQTLGFLSEADPDHGIEAIKTRDRLTQETVAIETRIANCQTTMSGLRKLLAQGAATAKTLTARMTAIEQEILKADGDKCPTCGQDWADTQTHLMQCVEQLERLQSEQDALSHQLEETGTELAAVETTNTEAETRRQQIRNDLAKLPKLHFNTIEEASTAFARREGTARKLADTQVAGNPHTEAYQQEQQRLTTLQADLAQLSSARDAEATKLKVFHSLADLEEAQRALAANTIRFNQLVTSENPYRETVDNLRTNALKEVDETEVRELKSRVEHIALLITLLADKDSPLRRAVLNEWLPELNMRVNRYLDRLELPHRMTFDADMTATFSYAGKTLVFGNLSAGQRLRAWLATNLAFREIFELINYRINLFFVDEVLDKGMSGRGAEVSYNLLNEMVAQEDKSIFLITHRQELVDAADHVLAVNLQDGLTSIAA